MNLSGKRFLITQPIMFMIGGSSVVTIELAEYLIKNGAKVVVYACVLGDPVKTICEEKGIIVDEAKNTPNYKLSDFDYIWVHSQILPESLLRDIEKNPKQKMPKFIFLHMSGMDWIPDEKPWIYDLENKLSSKSLFISEEVEKVNQDMLDPEISKGFFRNPAPLEYAKIKYRDNGLRNILVVSNHPPAEVVDAKKILENKGINVVMMGEKQKDYMLMTSEILQQYDAVITIAKTVPYCLVSGIPVYIYDMYSGGVGWLSERKFQKAKNRNFSGYQNKFYKNYIGDFFEKKTAEQIAQEITDGYEVAKEFQAKNKNFFEKEFLMDSVFPRILEDLKARNAPVLEKKYIEAVVCSEKFAHLRFESTFAAHELANDVKKIREENKDLAKRAKSAEEALKAKSYRLYKKLLGPYIKLKNIRRK